MQSWTCKLQEDVASRRLTNGDGEVPAMSETSRDGRDLAGTLLLFLPHFVFWHPLLKSRVSESRPGFSLGDFFGRAFAPANEYNHQAIIVDFASSSSFASVKYRAVAIDVPSKKNTMFYIINFVKNHLHVPSISEMSSESFKNLQVSGGRGRGQRMLSEDRASINEYWGSNGFLACLGGRYLDL